MIRLEKIDKIFNVGTVNENVLFEHFDFSVNNGDFVSIVGSNGSGKTTTLNIIGGDVPINSGRVMLDGNDITSSPPYIRSRRIGRVFQNPAVGTVPSMTIFENLSIADNKSKPFDLTFAVKNNRKKYYIELVAQIGLGLESKMDVKVGSLSGGQRQALALLMSTMTPVDLLLLDEHTAALDPHTAENIMILTDKVVKEKNLTAVMVTHNLRYAVEYGNRLVMMDKGKIVLDKYGEEKSKTTVDDILQLFNNISIECGN